MYLRSVRFRDWKAYVDATFEFPIPRAGKNVVLVGAKNGFGKTTLLEGLVLGLFGREGLPLVGRATFNETGSDRLEVSYNDFLERAFHAQARNQGRTSASVELVFEDEDGDRTRVQRIWHFSGSGKHRRDEEEVRIWVGPDEDLLSTPPLQDPGEFTRSYISQNFLPSSLAQFFLFDGEQVQRLAQRDMATQVRLGIEGILGVPVLRELAADLRDYAKDRRRKLGNVGDAKIDRLRAEIRDLEVQEEKVVAELSQITPQLEPLKSKQSQLLREMTALQGGTYANLKELFESKERFSRDSDRYKDEFRKLLASDISLALAGSHLRQQTINQLEAESAREQWELGKRQGDKGGLDRFLSSLGNTPPDIDPPLTVEQSKQIQERVRNAWHNIWFPPPENCADDYRHSYLTQAERNLVCEQLRKVDRLAIDTVSQLLKKIEELDSEVRKLDARIAQQSGIETEAERMKTDLEQTMEALKSLEARERDLRRDLDGLRGQLNPKRQELGKLQESLSAAEPQLRRSAKADKISTIIDTIIAEAFPLHVEAVAEAMSEAYQAMAHKNAVKRISIEPDCTVRLLGELGRDLREMDASAGESQIFALSLIAAIAKVSKRGFPIVMDTPLARLDPDHRRNVLKYFTNTEAQVVLLSHPDEVSGEYLDLIQDRIGASMHIDHTEIADGVGRSRVVAGYYDLVGAIA